MKKPALFGLLLSVVAVLSAVIYFAVIRRDAVSAFINARFPPVSIAEQRGKAIQAAATALAGIPAPNVAFAARIDQIERVLAGLTTLKQYGIDRIQLDGDQQLLAIDTHFSRVFDGDSLGLPDPARGVLNRLRPDVTGTVKAYMGVTGALTGSAQEPHLELKLLPALRSIDIRKVTIAGKYDVTEVGEALAAALNKYADNVTGELTRMPITVVTVPASLSTNLNASRRLRIENPAVQAEVEIAAATVPVSIRVLGIAPLIRRGEVAALAMLTPPAEGVQGGGVSQQPTFRELESAFDKLRESAFGVAPSGESWVAVRKDFVSYWSNSILGRASLCLSGKAELAEQRFNREIPIPDETTVDCTPTRDCSPKRACDFPANQDTRDCSRCILWRPGWPLGDGGCAQRGNDPFCEAAKAAQNAIYAADAAGKKADCERLKAQEKLICEGEKTGEKLLCEAGKEALKRLSRTGKFGNVDATVRGRAEGLRICLKTFALSPGLDTVQLAVNATGTATADVNLKFIPLDIVGHLTCQAPFTESRSFQATLRESTIPLSAGISVTDEGARPRLTLAVPSTSFSLRLQPSPTEFLLTSPNMTIACQGLNLLKPIVLAASAFVPELRGDIDYKLDPQVVSMDLPLPTQQIGPASVQAGLRQTAKALFMTGTVRLP